MNDSQPVALTENQISRKALAHILPIAVFMGFLLVIQILEFFGFLVNNRDAYPWYRYAPEQWLYPLQTIVCLILIKKYWSHFNFGRIKGLGFAILMGIVGITLWILPGHLFISMDMNEGWWKFFGFTERVDGFYPSDFLGENNNFFWFAIFMRFVRMVVVVSIVEEVFWRGFLMRYILDKDGNYWNQPFGKFSIKSYLIVTILFVLIHAPSDYFGAFMYGTITYLVAVKTKNLTACIIMHALANLLLGCYVLITGNFGYW